MSPAVRFRFLNALPSASAASTMARPKIRAVVVFFMGRRCSTKEREDGLDRSGYAPMTTVSSGTSSPGPPNRKKHSAPCMNGVASKYGFTIRNRASALGP